MSRGGWGRGRGPAYEASVPLPTVRTATTTTSSSDSCLPNGAAPVAVHRRIDATAAAGSTAIAGASPGPDQALIDYFISGHVDLSEAQFRQHYVSELERALSAHPTATFVIGTSPGADTMALEWLLQEAHCDPTRITLCVFPLPKSKEQLSVLRSRYRGVHVVMGPQGPATGALFRSYTERDAYMTALSREDIAWVRPEEETKALYGDAFRPGRVSGTERNILRRRQQRQDTQR